MQNVDNILTCIKTLNGLQPEIKCTLVPMIDEDEQQVIVLY